ncbi:hypothetical protein [Lacisediminihabitans sp. H27-G8]|uniref:hypothetical protein n=1 Tax=Lacisediminihabitans sp. H27-G8 TaxID=3111909 RepID=UPI0038FC33B1
MSINKRFVTWMPRARAEFTTQRDAKEYLAGVIVLSARGDYVDPREAQMTCDKLGITWMAAQSQKAIRVQNSRGLRGVCMSSLSGDIDVSAKFGTEKLRLGSHRSQAANGRSRRA